MAAKAKLSEHGLNSEVAVDVGSLSDIAAAKPITFPLIALAAPNGISAAIFTINTSNDHVLGPIGIAGKIVKATISSGRVASLGTGSFSLYVATTDGTTKTLVTNTIDPEAITVNVGVNFSIVAGLAARAATDVLFLRCTADNNAVATDASNVKVTVWVVPTDTAPTRGASVWGT